MMHHHIMSRQIKESFDALPAEKRQEYSRRASSSQACARVAARFDDPLQSAADSAAPEDKEDRSSSCRH
eukprot:803230-Karenia_brevis.AAC.1